MRQLRGLVAALAVLGVLGGVWRLEALRAGLNFAEIEAEDTPVTLVTRPGTDGPLVVVAHGFAGSRQMMASYVQTLASAGYRVAAFDFEGHGRNPMPMSGDVARVEGTTRLLVQETREVLEAALDATGWEGPVALLGHSMASDIVVRAADGRKDVAAIVGISMYSEAVTADFPERLLVISGAGEPRLRREAVTMLRQVDPAAGEGETATAGSVTRRAVVAPGVEHVGVLHSRTALRETLDWLDAAFGREPGGEVRQVGPWLLLALGAVVALGWPLAALSGAPRGLPPVPGRRLAMAVGLPAILVPLALSPVQAGLLPVLAADDLALHLGMYGALQLALLRPTGAAVGRVRPVALALILVLGIGVFGMLLDRYGASFWALGARLPVFLAMLPGAVLCMAADRLAVTGRGLGTAVLVRLGLLGSLVLAVAVRPAELFFLLVAVPVLLLYFLAFGAWGRWWGARLGALTPGLGSGALLAWALAASFPMHVG